jgi:small multidrug resistance pump
MSWIYLIFAILFEVSGTVAMKISYGFTKLVPSIMMIILYVISLSLLTLALKTLHISVAYAIWSGLGTAIIATIGFIWFKEHVTPLKIVSLGLIIAGVVGLNLSEGTHVGGEPQPIMKTGVENERGIE